MPAWLVLLDTNSASGPIREREMALHVTCMKERSSAYTVVVGKPEGERPRVRHRRASENNIKMEREIMS